MDILPLFIIIMTEGRWFNLKTTFYYIGTEGEIPDPWKQHTDFQLLVLNGILLEMKERGILSESQYRFLNDLLHKEYRKRTLAISRKKSDD